MEVGEPGSQKLQAEVSWIPTTPAKAILPKPVPIYANGEANQISQMNCLDTNGRQLNWAATAAIAGGNGGTNLPPPLDAISGSKGVSFGYLLALADAASAAQSAATHPGNNGGTNPFIQASNPEFSNPEANPPTALLSPQNPNPQQTQINLSNGNHEEPQGNPATFCRKNSLQFAPPTPDEAIRAESREIARMQFHMEWNDQAEKEKNVSAPEPDSNGTPHNRELCDPITESSVAAVSMPSNENDNPDKGCSDGIDLNKTPQQKPKRRKHRPKVISENKPKQTRKAPKPKPVQPKENPTGKRKYVRKKGVNKAASTTPPTEVTGESTEPIMPGPGKKSCRRALNFDMDEQAKDGNSASRENATMHHDKGIAVRVVETQIGLACDLNFSMKQALNDYMSLPKVTQAPCKSLPENNPSMTKPNVKSVRKNGKRKGQVFARDGHEKTASNIPKTETQFCQNGSNSNSGIFTPGLQIAGPKRKRTATAEHVDTSSMNLSGALFNELQAYNWMHGIQFPNVQKRRRSEKGQTSTTYTTSPVTATGGVRLTTYPQEHANASPYASESSIWSSGSEYNAARVPVIFEVTERTTPNTSQTFGYVYSSSRTGVTKRSKIPTHIPDLAALPGITCSIQQNQSLKQVGNSGRQTFENAERSQSCIDALGSSLAKKKRTRRKNTFVSSAYSSRNEMQLHKFVLDNHQMAFGNSLGAACILSSWNYNTVDALAEHFRHLDINRDGKYFACEEQNALVAYEQKNRKHDALLHESGGAIIPFEGPFDPIRKQRPRPKVDLDDETNRVWKLLMLDINSHGIDGTDEDKAKWWEEERSMFRGRADSFIARMHLVQGDRRFSCWKGSVVDSVVGVFLTQNVSDHLSSSAFMSLAARFPLRPSSSCKTNHEEGTSLVVNEPEENIKWDGKLLNQSLYDQSSMTIDNVEHSEEKEAVNSNDFSGTTSSVVSLADESNSKISKSAESNIQEQHSLMLSRPPDIITGEVHEKTCYEGGRKESNDIVLSQCSVISSQISDLSIDQNPEKVGSCSDSNSEVEDLSSTAKYNIFDKSTSFSKLLEMASSTMLHEVTSQRSKSTENSKDECIQSISKRHVNQKEKFEKSDAVQGSSGVTMVISGDCNLRQTPNSGTLEVHGLDPFKMDAPPNCSLKNKDENDMSKPNSPIAETRSQVAIAHSERMISQLHLQEQNNTMHKNLLNSCGHTQDLMQKPRESDSGDHNYAVRIETREMNPVNIKSKGKRPAKENGHINWDSLRIQSQAKGGKREKTKNTMDSLDWEAVRHADVKEIAEAIKERGMNNMLAGRIKDFLNRLAEEHGSIDLEWLRDVPPDKAKEYLLSIRGLGLKSVECVRLLTLHHLAFPVDTNVGRIAVRLGWVPLQPLPESLQLHLLELYPVLESIQKYLWPRLCKLDQRTLYELHYQMITFGKVFCTKGKPNCNACPMRGECRHFASAFASARLALPGPEQKSIVSTAGNIAADLNSAVSIDPLPLPLPEHMNQSEAVQQTELSRQLEVKHDICQPIIEEPATPEQECTQISEKDIEDGFYDDPDEIPTIKLDMEEFALNLQNYMQLQEGEMSKALVALTPEAASIPTPKLKNVNRLRTEHCVYELPDTHPLLEGCEMREPDDPCKYLLAIWTPGETADSTQPPESKCNSQECGQLCNEKECFSCNSIREANSQIVRATLLIPCRTAMRGSFPLNGTYFQVNEVFADHQSSLDPINVPRSLIWNLNRRTVYFGTSIPSIFKGLTTPEIQQCFWRGYVCVRGFDRETRAPRPLMARLHFPASKLQKAKDHKKQDEQ